MKFRIAKYLFKNIFRLYQLEEERFDYSKACDDQKYQLSTLRHRVNDLMNKSGKTKRVGKLSVSKLR